MSFNSLRQSKWSLVVLAGTGLLCLTVTVAARASLSRQTTERPELSPFHPRWLGVDGHSPGAQALLQANRPLQVREGALPVYAHVEAVQTQPSDPPARSNETRVVWVAGEDPNDSFGDLHDTAVLAGLVADASPIDVDSGEIKVVCCEIAEFCTLYAAQKCPPGMTPVPCPCPAP